MKKYLLAAGAGLLTTVAVTATVLSTHKPAAKKEPSKCTMAHKSHCAKMARTHCFD